jgi:hypothetical protein
MRFYLMAFILLFSSLATAWAGVMPIVNTSDSGLTSHTEQATVASHDCCPTMIVTESLAAQTLQKSQMLASQNYCPHCFDNCHCDSDHCANVHLSMATLTHSNTVMIQNHSQSIAVKPVMMISALQTQTFRPPKPL